MIIAQITDTHVKRKGQLFHYIINTGKRLRRCVDVLNTLDPRPDVVIATGDLVDAGKRKEYRRLRKILDRLAIPLYVIPGNHDRRDAFREAFRDHRYLPMRGDDLCYVIDEYPVRIIGLDTTWPDRPTGVLTAQRLSWLESTLEAEPEKPTLIAMHHPPIRTGVVWMDGASFDGLEAFGAIVARHPQIVRIACGHIHRAVEQLWNGTLVTTSLSTAYQFVLAIRGERPVGITREAPGFSLHVWDPLDGMTTHSVHVEKAAKVP